MENFTENQKNVIVGSLLGDGWLQSRKKDAHNSRFCKQQSFEKEEYVKWHYDYFQPYSSNKIYFREIPAKIWTNGYSVKKTSNFTFYTKSDPYFTELRRKWYPGEKDKLGYVIKRVPKDIEINAQVLAVWFADDGTNEFKGKRIIIYTDGFLKEDVDLLVKKLQKLDFKCKKIKRNFCKKEGCGYKIVFSSESYIKFIECIKPFFYWDCLKHKIDINKYNPLFGTNTSGYNGINWDKGRNKWRATITVDGKHMNLGRFKDINDAIKARKIADNKYNVRIGHKWIQEEQNGE